MKLKINILITTVMFILAMPSISTATCVFNGYVYAEGTIIGDRICTNGNWKLMTN